MRTVTIGNPTSSTMTTTVAETRAASLGSPVLWRVLLLVLSARFVFSIETRRIRTPAVLGNMDSLAEMFIAGGFNVDLATNGGDVDGQECDTQFEFEFEFEFEFALHLMLDSFERLRDSGWMSSSAHHREPKARG
ncbi:MAG: hypothetical protein KF680_03695 [Cryobacterium sp.]|nr:hypothetical protein [Cryobacterium sp.]